MNGLLKFTSIILFSLFAFAGVYFLKITLNKLIPSGSDFQILIRTMPQIILKPSFWLAIICYVAAMTIYLFLLQSDEVSKIFSITVGVNVLLTAIGASLFLGDAIDSTRALGILLVAIGIFLINGVQH